MAIAMTYENLEIIAQRAVFSLQDALQAQDDASAREAQTVLDLVTHIRKMEQHASNLAYCLLPVVMQIAYTELAGRTLNDADVVLSFMGGGASSATTVGDIRKAFPDHPV